MEALCACAAVVAIVGIGTVVSDGVWEDVTVETSVGWPGLGAVSVGSIAVGKARVGSVLIANAVGTTGVGDTEITCANLLTTNIPATTIISTTTTPKMIAGFRHGSSNDRLVQGGGGGGGGGSVPSCISILAILALRSSI